MQLDTESVLTAAAFVRTYDPPGYADPWQAVQDYQQVHHYAAQHPEKGSSAIANALNLPRGRIRPWVEDDARPDCVRGMETAENRGWLPLGFDSDSFLALNQLVAWVFSGGSINANYVPAFAATTESSQDVIATVFEKLDLPFRLERLNEKGRATEAVPEVDASVLGRVLSCLGAPVGVKNDRRQLSLPTYLEYAPPAIRRTFVHIYLMNRGVRRQRENTRIQLSEQRSESYLDQLASLIRTVARDERVIVSGTNIYLSEAAVTALMS